MSMAALATILVAVVTLTEAVAAASNCAARGSSGASPRNLALLQVHRQEKTLAVPATAQHLQAAPGAEGQFLYEAFRIGTAAHETGLEAPQHVYRMKGGAFTVQSIEPHVVRKKGGKEYEGWNTSSPILSSLMAEQAAKGKNITLAPVSAWAQRVTLAPNTPDVYVSVLYIAELDQYYYYMFEVQPPFRVLGMGAKPLPELLAQDSSIPEALGLLAEGGAHGGQRLAAIEDFLPSPPEWPRGVTLIVMAHKRDRLHGLLATVNRYCQSSPDLLHEVVMIWNNQTDPETVELMRQNTSGGAVPVRVLETDANSMNNRFAVWGALQTEGAIVQDDDMWVSSDSLQLLVDAWRQQPDRLFGAANERVDVQSRNATDKLTNGESWENNSYQWKEVNPKCYSQSSPDIPSDIPSDVPYCVFEARDYSILLPHPWVLSRRYLKEYMLNPEGTKLVDDMMNCDDIYLNSVVSNATRAAPIALDIPVHRFPEWANGDAMWVSQGKKWLEKRSRCLEKVNSMYAGEPVSEETGTVWRRNFSGLVLSEAAQGHKATGARHNMPVFEVADGELAVVEHVDALLWACQGAALLLLILGVTGRWLLSSHPPSGAAKERVAIYGNARFLMSVLMIYDHLHQLVGIWKVDPGPWLEGDDSSWHHRLFSPVTPSLVLTGFVVISGYVSQGVATPARWRSVLVNLLLPYLLYSGVLKPLLAYFVDGEYPSQETVLKVLDAAPNVEWYLQSLVLWRLMAFAAAGLAAKVGSPLWPWWLGICWAASFSATVWGAPLVWSMTHTIYFLPAFAVGQLFPLSELLQAVEPCLSVNLIGTAVLSAWVWAFGVLHGDSLPTLDAFRKLLAWKQFPVLVPALEAGATLGGKWGEMFLAPFLAVFPPLLYSAMVIILLATVIPRSTTCFTKAGGEGSLYIYLFHPFVISSLVPGLKLLPPDLVAALPSNYLVQSSAGHLAVYMFGLGLCLLLAAILSCDTLLALFNPFMKPEWLVNLALGAPPARTPLPSKGPKVEQMAATSHP